MFITALRLPPGHSLVPVDVFQQIFCFPGILFHLYRYGHRKLLFLYAPLNLKASRPVKRNDVCLPVYFSFQQVPIHLKHGHFLRQSHRHSCPYCNTPRLINLRPLQRIIFFSAKFKCMNSFQHLAVFIQKSHIFRPGTNTIYRQTDRLPVKNSHSHPVRQRRHNPVHQLQHFPLSFRVRRKSSNFFLRLINKAVLAFSPGIRAFHNHNRFPVFLRQPFHRLL